MHELRYGELAHFKLIPHTPYYGTADATPLYLITLHAAWRATGDRTLLERHLRHRRRLPGLDRQLRRPGRRRLPGIPDALAGRLREHGAGRTPAIPCSIRTARWCAGPRRCASCRAMSTTPGCAWPKSIDALGQPDARRDLRAKAAALFERFNDVFWDEETGFYAYTLDGEKRQVLTVASNPGHCLWSGIVPAERAGAGRRPADGAGHVSGWGIRTLSARSPGVQSVLVPERLGLAARQRHDRAGLQPLRLRRRGGGRSRATSATPPAISCPTSCPSCMPACSGTSAASRCSISAPTCRRPGRPVGVLAAAGDAGDRTGRPARPRVRRSVAARVAARRCALRFAGGGGIAWMSASGGRVTRRGSRYCAATAIWCSIAAPFAPPRCCGMARRSERERRPGLPCNGVRRRKPPP